MRNLKFKVGDRVAYTYEDGTRRVGTVKERSASPWVHFDDYRPDLYNQCIRTPRIPAGYADCAVQENLELIQPAMTQPTLEQVREAAKTSPEARKALEKLFPEIIEPEPFEFGKKHNIDVCISSQVLFIGNAFAPPGFEHKCLVVRSDYQLEVSEHKGMTILTFYKK